MLNAIKKLADDKVVTSSQLAIAWIIAKGIVPIPGTKRRKYLEQNMEAASITLTPQELEQLEAIVPLGTSTGERYDAANMAAIDQ